LNIIKYKEREQKQDLDLKTKMSKYMANASFYRLKFRTIDLMTNYWVGGHLLTWWQPLSSCLNKMALLKFWHLSQLSNKIRMSSFGLLELKIWVEHWTVFGLHDKFWLLFCCYNLNLNMVILNLELSWKC